MIKHVLVIYNPVSKSQVRNEEWIGHIVRELNRSGQYLISFFPTTAETTPYQLVPLIAPPLDLVIAAGGDGTIRFAIAALARAKSRVPLAIFPMGTGNVLARNLGIVDYRLFADPLEHVIDYLLHGRTMCMDLGMMNGEFFAGMAGIGPLSDAFVLPERAAKTNGKLFAYMKALLESVTVPTRTFKITTAAHSFKVEASGVFISNVEDLGIGKDPNPGSLIDGLLDLHIINPQEFRDYVALTKRYGNGIMAPNPADVIMKVKEAQVEVVPRQGKQSAFQRKAARVRDFLGGEKFVSLARTDKLLCMIDGDACGYSPMRVTVLPHAVNILVPPRTSPQYYPSPVLPKFSGLEHLPRAVGQ
jgi:diacylglycerol kinase (ATP)